MVFGVLHFQQSELELNHCAVTLHFLGQNINSWMASFCQLKRKKKKSCCLYRLHIYRKKAITNAYVLCTHKHAHTHTHTHPEKTAIPVDVLPWWQPHDENGSVLWSTWQSKVASCHSVSVTVGCQGWEMAVVELWKIMLKPEPGPQESNPQKKTGALHMMRLTLVWGVTINPNPPHHVVSVGSWASGPSGIAVSC